MALGNDGIIDWEGISMENFSRYKRIRRVLESELDDMNGIETVGVVESVHRRWGRMIEYASPEEECDRSSLREVTKEVLSSTYLTSNERTVLRKRYMEEWTYEAIAQKLDLSRERIRQIELKALRKLRHPNEIGKYLRNFE
jgi:RNA polymerase sigma factor (sigma-70 family)